MITKEMIAADIDALPKGYKTADIDELIRRYVREKQDLSCLRSCVLDEQRFHRIYFHGSLKQIDSAIDRIKWIDENLLFSDWWHTDQCIDSVKDVGAEVALGYARRYVYSDDPFVRRWGYVMFISKLCRDRERLDDILSLFHDDDHYYVQMAEAWLMAELAIFFPDEILARLKEARLSYDISGKAIQKICDSHRISDEYKAKFRELRPLLKNRQYV